MSRMAVKVLCYLLVGWRRDGMDTEIVAFDERGVVSDEFVGS